MTATKLHSLIMMLHQPYHPRRKLILILFTIGFFLGTTFFSKKVENELNYEVHAARNYALRSAHHATDGTKTISYVTSFWARDRPTTHIVPHRREIEAALLANIYNPHIDQVVVFLDGVITGNDVDEEHQSTCAHFHRDIKEIRNRFLKISGYAENKHHNGVDPMSKMACVNVATGQPTYHQMFLNALSNVVVGDVVVMANADMAFDDSIAKARLLKEDVLAVLGTRGFSKDIPASTKQFYDSIVGAAHYKNWDVNQCQVNPWSWDTWIFHKKTVQGQLHEEHFQRPSIISNEMTPFFMNENGAENAALWAMEQSSNFATSYNACDEIQSWSFHLTDRTHHSQGSSKWSVNGSRAYIPKPWGGSKKRRNYNGIRQDSPPYPPKWCEKEDGCFID